MKRYIETNDNDSTTYQNLWDVTKSGHKRKVHIITGLTPKTRRSPNKQPNALSLKN